ncbi:MAG: guanylate kinase [Elusimicrobiota bacterium]
MKRKGIIFVISAPSGTGKSTLCGYLFRKIANLKFSVSCTTRKPRRGERNGREYFFVSGKEFKNRIKEHKFAEWALVHGSYYGTLKSQLEKAVKAGRDILLDIDVVGALNIKMHFHEAVMIFIVPPSFHELKRRLVERGQDTPESVRLRLANAKDEIKYRNKYEYVVVNDKIPAAVKELESIIIAERDKAAMKVVRVYK